MTRLSQTVYVVDDDDAVRDSLSVLLNSVGMDVATFDSPVKFLNQFRPEQAGCLILDIRMPGMSGLELQQRLTALHSILPIIFITGHGDVPMAVEAMQKGAVDFVQKPFRDQELLDRIHKALDRNSEHHEELMHERDIRGRIDTLTARERQVMDAVCDGLANKVIALDLGVSQRTIEIHRARVMNKMGARSVAHLVRIVTKVENLV